MNLKACRQREDGSLSQTRTYHDMMHTGYWEHFISCHNSFVNYSDFLTWSHDTEGDGFTKYDRKICDLFSLTQDSPPTSRELLNGQSSSHSQGKSTRCNLHIWNQKSEYQQHTAPPHSNSYWRELLVVPGGSAYQIQNDSNAVLELSLRSKGNTF